MAEGGLFVGFGFPVRGRERQAVQVFNELIEYLTGLQKQGEIQGFEPVFLEAHGGDLGGFVLVRGDEEKLARLRVADEFLRLEIRAQLIVESFGVVGAFVGEAIGREMGRFQAQLDELT